MRTATWLTALIMAAVAALVPLCLPDCLSQPVQTAASCHSEEHSEAPSGQSCPDCQRAEFVKPKTTQSLAELDSLPAASSFTVSALDTVAPLAIDSPACQTAVAAPPLVLRL